jgi:hypothetical protein
MQVFLKFILVIFIISSCQSIPDGKKDVSTFNLYLTKEDTLVIDHFEVLLDKWYLDHTNEKYQGAKMIELLKEMSKQNYIYGFIVNDADCESFNEISDIERLENILNIVRIKEKKGHDHRGIWNDGNFINEAITSYASDVNDSSLLMISDLEVVFDPAEICRDYGRLSAEQLDNPIYKRLLFMELFLNNYWYHCVKGFKPE